MREKHSTGYFAEVPAELPEDLVFDIDAETEEQAAAIAELLLTCSNEEEAIAMLEDLNRRMMKH